MKFSFSVFTLAILASAQAISPVVTERDDGYITSSLHQIHPANTLHSLLVVERSPEPGLLKAGAGLIAGAIAAGAAKKGAKDAAKGGATPASAVGAGPSGAASAAPLSSAAAARRRRRQKIAEVAKAQATR
ncbi:hypothetical protein VTL71DRAFT_6904 [Oculimacula yallundae]|uniref:Antifreeze protein n=1 Tax=Oculimacula yallundae TaxID=86028 RepID=A0ABR4BV79_9HELO